MSPLAARETSQATGLPVLDLEMLHTQAANLGRTFISTSDYFIDIQGGDSSSLIGIALTWV